MSTVFSVIKYSTSGEVLDKKRVGLRYAGYTGCEFLLSTEIVRVNQNLDNLFLRLSEYLSKGYTLAGSYDYEHHNGLNAMEFMEELRKNYKPAVSQYNWEKMHPERSEGTNTFVSKDGWVWTDSEFV